MASASSLRLWRTCKATTWDLWPKTGDDVLDYMILEAVTVRIRKEEEKEAKKQEAQRKAEEARQRIKGLV